MSDTGLPPDLVEVPTKKVLGEARIPVRCIHGIQEHNGIPMSRSSMWPAHPELVFWPVAQNAVCSWSCIALTLPPFAGCHRAKDRNSDSEEPTQAGETAWVAGCVTKFAMQILVAAGAAGSSGQLPVSAPGCTQLPRSLHCMCATAGQAQSLDACQPMLRERRQDFGLSGHVWVRLASQSLLG